MADGEDVPEPQIEEELDFDLEQLFDEELDEPDEKPLDQLDKEKDAIGEKHEAAYDELSKSSDKLDNAVAKGTDAAIDRAREQYDKAKSEWERWNVAYNNALTAINDWISGADRRDKSKERVEQETRGGGGGKIPRDSYLNSDDVFDLSNPDQMRFYRDRKLTYGQMGSVELARAHIELRKYPTALAREIARKAIEREWTDRMGTSRRDGWDPPGKPLLSW